MAASRGRRAWGVDMERVLQIGFLVLLAVCVAQVLWWIIDEVGYTRRVNDAIVTHYERDASIAREMMARGIPREVVLRHFEALIPSGETDVAVDPAVVDELERLRDERLDRFGWEGGFFLLVLVAGVLVLARAMRQDTTLRRRQQNFVAAVSHEFKSPLASIRLSAETLLYRKTVDDETRQRVVRRLVDDIDRLEVMVTNILDTARVEEGELHLEPSRVGVAEVVAATLRSFEGRAAESGIELATDVDPDLEVFADPVAVRAVLRNLVDNAIKATESNDGGEVRIAARREGRHVRVVVADNGVGFAPDEAERLFEKFYRPGDEMQRRSRGSGLGLYLVQHFVRLEGGRVEAHSQGPGRGAEFSALWPTPTEASS
jgi:signal transduction histidine kinase